MLGDLHPTAMAKARLHSQSMMLDNPSAPYHAKSSTYNPVSRNDSELQSQSSGEITSIAAQCPYHNQNTCSSTKVSSTWYKFYAYRYIIPSTVVYGTNYNLHFYL